jgi:hypothetical protein
LARKRSWVFVGSGKQNGSNLSRLPACVGVERVALRSQPMPQTAVDAALDTFALVMRERHPGVVAVPLRDVGTNGAVVSPAAGKIVRPFAAPKDRHPVLDWNASVTPRDYYRVNRAAEDALAVRDR